MEISKLYSNAIGAYKKVTSSAAKTSKSAQLRDNKDKVEFNLDSSLSAAKANIASCAEADASASRIEQLGVVYSGDNCPVTSEQVAEAIING